MRKSWPETSTRRQNMQTSDWQKVGEWSSVDELSRDVEKKKCKPFGIIVCCHRNRCIIIIIIIIVSVIISLTWIIVTTTVLSLLPLFLSLLKYHVSCIFSHLLPVICNLLIQFNLNEYISKLVCTVSFSHFFYFYFFYVLVVGFTVK